MFKRLKSLILVIGSHLIFGAHHEKVGVVNMYANWGLKLEWTYK